tara:strand:+ start:74 stop:298 length:225 start_codon:yes stop_codon:yes gene_type:complete
VKGTTTLVVEEGDVTIRNMNSPNMRERFTKISKLNLMKGRKPPQFLLLRSFINYLKERLPFVKYLCQVPVFKDG